MLLKLFLIFFTSFTTFESCAATTRPEQLQKQYAETLKTIKEGNTKELTALAQWCQQNKLITESLEAWQKVVVLEPNNAEARGQLDKIRAIAWAEAPTGLLKNQKVPDYSDETAWYHISVPNEHKTSRSGMPLIIFLHGGHHNAGTADNIVALAQVLPIMKKNIVVFPNHLRTWWAHPHELKYLLDTLDQVMLRWHVDTKRIYLMGVSMGGNGAWAFGSQCPELFAAIAPASGWWTANLGFPMNNLIPKPVYILHGTSDTTVPIKGARQAFTLLKKDSTSVTMREIEGGSHVIPIEEFSKALEWMMPYSNKQEFDLKAMKERINKLPVPGWLKQYEGK